MLISIYCYHIINRRETSRGETSQRERSLGANRPALQGIDMATSKEEGSVFDCPICLEKLSNPKYLPCLHTFCELCIQSFIDSSISDCIVNRRNISFDCPVCRRVNQAPTQNISAKEWAEQLPKNHQLLAIKDSYEKGNNTESKVFCDSCTQNNEQVIATLRCKSCRVILCESCCKRIHKKVRSYADHTIVDLRSANTEVDNADELGNCVVHTNRAIEYFFSNNVILKAFISCIDKVSLQKKNMKRSHV